MHYHIRWSNGKLDWERYGTRAEESIISGRIQTLSQIWNMSIEAVHAAYVERRRSMRVPIRLALIVCGDNGRLQEETCTLSLNAHGVLVALAARVTIGQRPIIHNPENWEERRGPVTSLGGFTQAELKWE
jgi:hypothetical protein